MKSPLRTINSAMEERSDSMAMAGFHADLDAILHEGRIADDVYIPSVRRYGRRGVGAVPFDAMAGSHGQQWSSGMLYLFSDIVIVAVDRQVVRCIDLFRCIVSKENTRVHVHELHRGTLSTQIRDRAHWDVCDIARMSEAAYTHLMFTVSDSAAVVSLLWTTSISAMEQHIASDRLVYGWQHVLYQNTSFSDLVVRRELSSVHNDVDVFGSSLLHLAAASDHTAAINELLLLSPSLTLSKDMRQWTSLHVAIACRCPAATEALLSKLSTDILDHGSQLLDLCLQGDIDSSRKGLHCLRLLAEHAQCPLNVTLGSHHESQTPLQRAIVQGWTNTVLLLLACGACPRHSASGTRLPLALAVDRGHLDITNALLAYGAPPNAAGSQCRPMDLAATAPLANTLVRAGARFDSSRHARFGDHLVSLEAAARSNMEHRKKRSLNASTVLDPKEWVPDTAASECMACGSGFSVVHRKHHCRSCGWVVCAACSTSRCQAQKKAVRVCDGCANRMESQEAMPSAEEVAERVPEQQVEERPSPVEEDLMEQQQFNASLTSRLQRLSSTADESVDRTSLDALLEENQRQDAVIQGLLAELGRPSEGSPVEVLEARIRELNALLSGKLVRAEGKARSEMDAAQTRRSKHTRVSDLSMLRRARGFSSHAFKKTQSVADLESRISELEHQLMYGEGQKDRQIDALLARVKQLEAERATSRSLSQSEMKSMRDTLRRQQREALEAWIFEENAII